MPLADHRLLLLARHGGLCWGDTKEEAAGGMERLEQVAELLGAAFTLPTGPLMAWLWNEAVKEWQ